MAKPWDSKGHGSRSSGKRRLDKALADINVKGGATTAQARRLRENGFKVWARSINPSAPKGKIKTPTIAWIKDNLSMAQAGLILRELGYGRQVKSRIPKRPMMEMNKQAVNNAMVSTVRNRR